MNGLLELEAIVATIGSVATGNHALVLLLALQAVDIVSGVVSAWGRNAMSSEVSKKGISEKVLILLGVAMSYLLGSLVGAPLGPAAAIYYCYHEALSIAENLTQAGLPLPETVKRVLVRTKDEQPAALAAPAPPAKAVQP